MQHEAPGTKTPVTIDASLVPDPATEGFPASGPVTKGHASAAVRFADSGSGTRTNALRIVNALGIQVRTVSYEVDEENLDAVSVAAKIGMEAERVFKTLALKGGASGIFLCCVPGDTGIDLRKAARASGNKNVEMLPLKELQPATGYIRGGCSPVGTKKKFPVYIDETARLFEEIAVSAGMRGLQMIIAPGDLVRAAQAEYADLI